MTEDLQESTIGFGHDSFLYFCSFNLSREWPVSYWPVGLWGLKLKVTLISRYRILVIRRPGLTGVTQLRPYKWLVHRTRSLTNFPSTTPLWLVPGVVSSFDPRVLGTVRGLLFTHVWTSCLFLTPSPPIQFFASHFVRRQEVPGRVFWDTGHYILGVVRRGPCWPY